MIRRWRRRLVLAAVAAAAVVGGVLLATEPWSDGETLVQEAAGGTSEQRICDVVMEIPPRGQGPDIVTVVHTNHSIEGQLRGPVMMLRARGSGNTAEVLFDALTGTVLEERYETPSQEATVQQVLQTVRVEPLDPSKAPWPYTDTAQVSAQRVGEKGTFQYRFPDPGSGLMITQIHMDGIDGYANGLRVENCRSLLEILVTFRPGAEREVKVTKEIHLDDEAAFQTFYDQVTVNNDPLGR